MPISKKARIICIGSELSHGFVQEALAKNAARDLYFAGFEITQIQIIPDDREIIADAFYDLLNNNHDFCLISGGLGPTTDDLTREILAKVCGKPLVFHEVGWTDFLNRYGDRLDHEANRMQYYIPQGFNYVQNPYGTAACFEGQIGKLKLLCLPGVPAEFNQLWKDYYPGLAVNGQKNKEFLSVYFVGESALQKFLSAEFPAYDWHTEASVGRVYLGCQWDSWDRKSISGAIKKEFAQALCISGRAALSELVYESMNKAGMTISFAESCTGGAAASELSAIPGASSVLYGGWITYDNRAKISILGVSEQTLDEFGAVSLQVVTQMANQARLKSGTDLAISISGIAGPTGGSEEKPVGTVWIGLAGDEVMTRKYRFSGARNKIRLQAVYAAYGFILEYLVRFKRLDSEEEVFI